MEMVTPFCRSTAIANKLEMNKGGECNELETIDWLCVRMLITCGWILVYDGL